MMKMKMNATVMLRALFSNRGGCARTSVAASAVAARFGGATTMTTGGARQQHPITPTMMMTSARRELSSTAAPLVPGVGKGKTSTGLVGLPVNPNAIADMVTKYQALLDVMANSDMPETAHYRVTVEKIARFRLQAARDHPDDPEAVEAICNCGQVEELVEQADDEMEVLQMYLRERWWEQIEETEIEYNPDPETDHGDNEEAEWTEGGNEAIKQQQAQAAAKK